MNSLQRWTVLSIAGLLIACSGQQQFTSETQTPQQYAVGSSTVFIHDESRPYDSVANVNTGVRTLITELWYPVDQSTIDRDPSKYARATYGDYVFGNPIMHKRMMTETTFFHLRPDTVRAGVSQSQIDEAIAELFSRERGSYIDAPVSSSGKKLPVIVMSHGDAGSRYNMETTSEYLAAHGYLVIAPEHTGNTPYAMTGSDPALAIDGDPEFQKAMTSVLPLLDNQGSYGSLETYGQSYTPLAGEEDVVKTLIDLDASLLQRLNDLRAAIQELEQMNREGPFAGRLDLERIGLIGRSFGGVGTLVGLALEDRFTAGFAVVPPGFADVRSALPKEVLAPANKESAMLSADEHAPFYKFTKPTFILNGAEDTLIIRMGAEQAKAAGLSMPNADNPHPVLRSTFETTDSPVIWSVLAESNHSTLGVSGGYWWPELKPDTAKRTFDPESSFRLIDPAIAHKIQREKALAFFDLTIRQDESARARVLDQEYSEQGLTLEARNF
ncbi:MAG: acetylhydrolase [Halioglobus sp.]